MLTNANVTLPDGTLVKRYNVLTTSLWVYEAYVPQTSLVGGCGTITSEVVDGKVVWFGKVGTDPLPADVAAIPAWVGGKYNDARGNACDAFRSSRYEFAYRAITQAFPEAADGVCRNGEIEVRV